MVVVAILDATLSPFDFVSKNESHFSFYFAADQIMIRMSRTRCCRVFIHSWNAIGALPKYSKAINYHWVHVFVGESSLAFVLNDCRMQSMVSFVGKKAKLPEARSSQWPMLAESWTKRNHPRLTTSKWLVSESNKLTFRLNTNSPIQQSNVAKRSTNSAFDFV